MRVFNFLTSAILSILIASSAALYAQDEKQEEPKRHEEPRPATKPDQMKPPHEEKQSKPEKQEEKQGEKQSREQMKAGEKAHARPAGKSAHIPDEKFRAQFGRTHTFKVQSAVVGEGQSRFVYGGYTFVFVDPWPVEWAFTDDCYVDYIDGEYFLFDVFHPGVRVALFVVM